MKVKVNKEKCYSCGACKSIAPEVFDFDDDGYAEVKSDADFDKYRDDIMSAKDACPGDAIEEIEA